MESFDAGELLVVLSSDEGYTTFCRCYDPADLYARPCFTIKDEQFALLTEQ